MPATASATQSPLGCKSNEMKISIGRDRGVPVYANGETITYTIKVSNVGAEGCDVDGVTMVLHLPAADGTPTGQTVTLVTGASFPVGSAERVISTIPYKLAVNPGVVDAVAQVQVTAGLLHDAPTDHQYRELKEVGTDVVKPTDHHRQDRLDHLRPGTAERHLHLRGDQHQPRPGPAQQGPRQRRPVPQLGLRPR